MMTEVINYTDNDDRNDLLSRLCGSVFHITTQKAFKRIQRDGFIYHNRDGRFDVNVASKASYGRQQGWVCLFDLRGHSNDIIENGLLKYNFLGPSWFNRLTPNHIITKNAYLILSPKAYNIIIPNNEAIKAYEETSKWSHYVPHIECWYPGDMPIDMLQKVLFVNIRKKAPKHDTFLYAHHMIALEERNKKRQGIRIK